MKKLFFTWLFAIIACFGYATEQSDTVRILAIGNSFTEDALSSYFVPICQSVGKNVIVGYPYKGGSSLQNHWERLLSKELIYNYKKNIKGTWTTTGGSSRDLSTGIIDEPWDIVVYQQAHYEAGFYETFVPYLKNLKDSVTAMLPKPAKHIWFFTWADDKGCTKDDFVNRYNSNQDSMYHMLRDVAYQIYDEYNFDAMIPAATVIQNCRTTFIGNHMTRDGYHMNYNYGRYALSLVWAATVLGIDPQTVPYYPPTISANMAQLCKDAVSAAIQTPNSVTSLAEQWGTNPDVNPSDRPEPGTPWDGTTAVEPISEGDCYLISTGAELAWVANASNTGVAYAHDIKLTHDIDLGGHPWVPIGLNATTDTKNFYCGNIEGQGYTIKGLYIETNNTFNNAGLIGGFGGNYSSTAVIRDLNLEGEIVVPNSGSGDIGSIAGFINSLAIIENCHSKVNITYTAKANACSYLGGLVGRLKGTSIKNCSYTGTISLANGSKVSKGWGGLVGSYNSTTAGLLANVDSCIFGGVIDSKTVETSAYGAGVIGYSNLSKGTVNLRNCTLKGSMSVVQKPTAYGKWIGKGAGTINQTNNLCDHFVMDGVEYTDTVAPDPGPDPEDSTELRVLCIGNSFTVDAVEDFLTPILESAGKKKVIIGYPYKGGTTLEMHMDYINTANPIYNYRKITHGTHTAQATTRFEVGLQDEKWDYVVIQTDHNYSGIWSHYFPHLSDLMSFIRTNGKNHDPRFFLYMTWAYDEGSTYKDFPLYGNNQITMYNQIVDCAYRAADSVKIKTIIPTGTAVQNLRTTYIGQHMNRDGYHMDYNYGRYTAGLMFANVVFGVDMDSVTYHPLTITDSMAIMCREAVKFAVATPKSITDMSSKWGKPHVEPEDTTIRPIPGTPWDGKMLVKPAVKDGSYIITTGAELAWVASQSNESSFTGTLIITHDIDLGNNKWTPIGQSLYFNGNIYGQGHSIKGLYLEPAAANINCGLIGQTNNKSSVIQDLTLYGKLLIKYPMTGSNADIGSFIGFANALKTIDNCHSYVDFVGEGGFGIYTGGIAGRVKSITVNRCSYNGTMTIATSDSKTKGWGGLIGTFNSGVANAIGCITNSYMNGKIVSTSTNATKYGGGLVGYTNLSEGVCTINNNYIGGTITITGTMPQSYGIVAATATGEGKNSIFTNNYIVNHFDMKADKRGIDVTVDDLHSGKLCHVLNTAEADVFGQDLADSLSKPVICIPEYEVYATTFSVADTTYATTYNNHYIHFPANPVQEGFEFVGWYDSKEGGNLYTPKSYVATHLTLYAHFTEPTSVSAINKSTTNAVIYNLAGQRLAQPQKGINIINNKTVKY